MITGNEVENSGWNVNNFWGIQVQVLLVRLKCMRLGTVIISLFCSLLAGEIQAQSAPKAQDTKALIQFNNSVEALH